MLKDKAGVYMKCSHVKSESFEDNAQNIRSRFWYTGVARSCSHPGFRIELKVVTGKSHRVESTENLVQSDHVSTAVIVAELLLRRVRSRPRLLHTSNFYRRIFVRLWLAYNQQSRIKHHPQSAISGRCASTRPHHWKVSQEYFDRQSEQWRDEQSKVSAQMAAHQNANVNYIDSGVRILELAQRAGMLYENQTLHEKRRILRFVFSNSVWRDGRLSPKYRKPFDFLVENNQRLKKEKAASPADTTFFDNWLPGRDSNPRPGD